MRFLLLFVPLFLSGCLYPYPAVGITTQNSDSNSQERTQNLHNVQVGGSVINGNYISK